MPRRYVKNANRLRKKLKRMPDEITEALKDQIAKGANDILLDAKAWVHVSQETFGELLDWRGRPRKHLYEALRVSITSKGLTARVGIIGKKAADVYFYARYLEFGTKKMPAYPFLLPAFRSNIGELRRRIKIAAQHAFETVANAQLSDE